MIYLDNAATGGFKPRAVTDAVHTVIRYLSANPGRSGHRLSLTGAQIVYDTRKAVGEAFNATPERVIFTKNCTEALNTAIFGTLKVGGHVITTVYEHNSVLRPLHVLKEKGLISLSIVAQTKEKPLVTAIEEQITQDTYLIVMTAASNVTGQTFPVEQVGALAKERQLLFIVDGAQAGGHIKLNVKDDNITALALAGHKGLYSIMGSGVLILNDNACVNPLLHGGTGTESHSLEQPSVYPERLESGTLNLPAIASLNEGIRFIKKNIEGFGVHLLRATENVISALEKIPNVKCYSTPNVCGIVAFSIDGFDSTEVADVLSKKYDVAVRGGLHCSPLIHKHLNTFEGGLVRVSLAVQNSSSEIAHFLYAVREIANS